MHGYFGFIYGDISKFIFVYEWMPECVWMYVWFTIFFKTKTSNKFVIIKKRGIVKKNSTWSIVLMKTNIKERKVLKVQGSRNLQDKELVHTNFECHRNLKKLIMKMIQCQFIFV